MTTDKNIELEVNSLAKVHAMLLEEGISISTEGIRQIEMRAIVKFRRNWIRMFGRLPDLKSSNALFRDWNSEYNNK